MVMPCRCQCCVNRQEAGVDVEAVALMLGRQYGKTALNRISQLEADCAAYREALQELVALKEMKDHTGPGHPDYYTRKPKAWKAAKEALSLDGGTQMLEKFEAECIEIAKGWGEFRGKIRRLLHENGVVSNPGWTEADIVDALRAKLAESEREKKSLRIAFDNYRRAYKECRILLNSAERVCEAVRYDYWTDAKKALAAFDAAKEPK